MREKELERATSDSVVRQESLLELSTFRTKARKRKYSKGKALLNPPPLPALWSWILNKNWLKVWDWKRRNWSISVVACSSCYKIKIAFLILFWTHPIHCQPCQLSPQMPRAAVQPRVGSRKGKCELGKAAAHNLGIWATARPIKNQFWDQQEIWTPNQACFC